MKTSQHLELPRKLWVGSSRIYQKILKIWSCNDKADKEFYTVTQQRDALADHGLDVYSTQMKEWTA